MPIKALGLLAGVALYLWKLWQKVRDDDEEYSLRPHFVIEVKLGQLYLKNEGNFLFWQCQMALRLSVYGLLPFCKDFKRNNKSRLLPYIRPVFELIALALMSCPRTLSLSTYRYHIPSEKPGFQRAGFTYFVICRLLPSQP
jgi:hypothetical protein